MWKWNKQNTEAWCGYDGGDCEEFNEKYPDCKTKYPSNIGNDYCDSSDPYNTEACKCLIMQQEFNGNYPDCEASLPSRIGDGDCDKYDSFQTLADTMVEIVFDFIIIL